MLEKNPNSVKIVYKNFPLSFHKQAKPAAKAAFAAAKQGKFWQYHDLLYANYSQLSPSKYSQFAKDIGLNMEAFNRVRGSREAQAQINRDVNAARQAGVTGTPAIYVNGHKVSSKNRNIPYIQKLIDAELKKK